MRTCKECGVPMKEVISFSKGKSEKFYRCPICQSETRHKRAKRQELDFTVKTRDWRNND